MQRLLQYTGGRARSFLVDEFSDKPNVFRAKKKSFMDGVLFVRETTDQIKRRRKLRDEMRHMG
jgi:hypothetical protein